MKKTSFCLITFALIASIVYAQSKSTPLIITSTTDICAIAKAVIGDKGEAVSVMTGGDDPDFIIPHRAAVFRAKEADFFLKNGIGLEEKWESQLHSEIGNAEINIGAIGNIVVTSGIDVLPTKSDDGKTKPIIHSKGNPYVWLDWKNGKTIASNICEFLCVTYPKWEKEYRANLSAFNKSLEEGAEEWKKRMEPLKGQKIVAYQHTFDYFTNKYGLKVVQYLEPAAGIPPTDTQVDNFIKFIKDNKIQLFIIADYNSRKFPNEIAQETGVELLVLPASVGDDIIDTYPKLFDQLTKLFKNYNARNNAKTNKKTSGSNPAKKSAQ